jgi:YesN/AraC family two-component response regulator
MRNEPNIIRLLIADDERIEKMYLYQFLQENFSDQCLIYQAENGREALEIFKEHQIQVSILDIEMPGINGIKAAEEMKRINPDCCIIFLSAYDDFSYARKAISIHALDYLLKPYQEDELLAVVEDALRITRGKSSEERKPTIPFENRYGQEEEIESLKPGDIKEAIMNYVRNHYDTDISMQEAAQAFHYSEAHFCKLFKQAFRMNFTAFLTQFRVEKAKQLLEKGKYNVKEIGEAVGYSDANYFAKVFRRMTGKSPSEYRLCIMYKETS